MTKRKPPRPEPRVLNDPRAIRALAHPARLAALEALGGGIELTATECAARAGVSPSAMSYHLRALEKWGIVERVDSSADGRERPWRAYPGGFKTDSLPNAAAAAATTAFTRLLLGQIASELETWFDHERAQPQEWRRAGGYGNSQVWLTAEEIEQARKGHLDLVERYSGRTAADHPEGARRTRVMHITVPLQLD